MGSQKDFESVGGSALNSGYETVGDLLATAKRIASEPPRSDHQKKKEKKGHMALRNNVFDLKLDLWHILKPLEYYLVDILIDKTIKWREREARITIEELKERTRQHHSEIYRALKSLEDKKIITRRKYDHRLIIGLNEDYFGGLLIKRHEDALQSRRKKIKVVVDNSKKPSPSLCKTPTQAVGNSHNLVANPTQELCGSHTQNDSQNIETIQEKPLLKTSFKDISLNTSLQSGETPPNLGDRAALSREAGSGTQKQEHPVPGNVPDSQPIDITGMDPRWKRFAMKGMSGNAI